MPESDDLDSLAKDAREGGLLLFCGAGVSMLAPSKSPSWWEIYVAAATALEHRFREGFPEISAALSLDDLLRPLQTQQLADLIVSRFAGGTFVEVLQAVDVADANENHMLIVALAAVGRLRGVVTTNFDTLLERTAAIRGISWAVAAPGLAIDRIQDRRQPLIKLHGSAVDARHLIETSSQKAREISPELAAAWNPILKGSNLLVLGYSGADLNFGAAGAFFQDFVASGGRIWWLHLPGARPALPDWVHQRTTFVEGALPDLLLHLAEALGASRFEMPIAGRDAQMALRSAMEKWSQEVHIGRWGAAVFFYALGRSADRAVEDSPLNRAIEKLARETAARFTAGAGITIDDLGVAGFLAEVGRYAIARVAFEEAVGLFRATVNLYENFNRWLDDSGHQGSFQERHMNLASSWGNYGQSLMVTGKVDEALKAFRRSLQHAYLAGQLDTFLVGITNVLHYGFQFKEVRRCMRIAEAGVRTADRLGGVQSSIELRLLLAGYHIDRNEIWAAADVLQEAYRRALALHDRSQWFVRIMQGHLLLKQGKLREGLTAIAETVSARPHSAFLHYPADEVRKYLDVLGIRQKGPFVIDLAPESIPEAVQRIEVKMAAARAEHTLPWKGRHCRVSESSGLGEDYMGALFELGVCEFEGNAGRATGLGLALAGTMLERGLFHDARWAAINVLARPAVPESQLGWAHSFLAEANAELGYLEEAAVHFGAARGHFASAGAEMPGRALATVMWLHIQSGDARAAAEWAGKLGKALAREPDAAARCADVAGRIDTWGLPIAEAGAAFRRAASTAGIVLPQAVAPKEGARPFRRFAGVSAEVPGVSAEQAKVLMAAQRALSEQDAERALGLLDESLSRDPADIPEHELGIALALRVQALSATQTPADLDLKMDPYRERLTADLAFSALTRLETAMVWSSLLRGDRTLAPKLVAAHSFVAEFSADPQARVSLFAWEAHFALLRHPSGGNRRMHFAALAAHYFGTAEAQVLRSPGADGEENGPAASGGGPALDTPPDAAAARLITEEFAKAMSGCQDAARADTALNTAMRTLRHRKLLTPRILAVLLDGRALWALQARRFVEAARLYRKAARAFRLAREEHWVLNTMAGEARALSRSGEYGGALQVFERALAQAKDLPVRATLLLGLASAHLLEATERRGEIDLPLTDKAIAVFQEAIKASGVNDSERALARLGLARALGQRGQQGAALAELDQATVELAHLGSPNAKILIENRKIFEGGQWQVIGLY